MKKYLVDVYLPASGQHFDAFLPAWKQVHEVTKLLVNITSSLSGGSYQGTQDAMLLNAENGIPLDADSTVHDVGIRDASRLILI